MAKFSHLGQQHHDIMRTQLRKKLIISIKEGDVNGRLESIPANMPVSLDMLIFEVCLK